MKRFLRIAAAAIFVLPWIMAFLVAMFDPGSNAVGIIFLIPICAVLAAGLFAASFFVPGRPVLGSVVGVAVALGLGLTGYWFVDRLGGDLYHSNSFESAQSAAFRVEQQRGWFPDWFPDAAVNIHHIHDLDTNVSISVFDLPQTSLDELLSSGCLTLAGDNLTKLPEAFLPLKDWDGNKVEAGIKSGSIDLYVCVEQDGAWEQRWILAVEELAGEPVRGYLWNEPMGAARNGVS